MMHNTDFDTPDYKTITAGKLIELLQRIPPDAEVWCNQVRNLSLGHNLKIIGHIDIASDELDLYAESDDE
jgi:hypothetical protein